MLDQPHTADVRALESSEFYVAEAATLLVQDPMVLLYVSAIMAQRLNRANQALIELKSQIRAGQPPNEISKTVQKIEEMLGPSGGNLTYGGYPYDPFA